MKKLLLPSLLLISSHTVLAEPEYILTESSQGSSFLFEKDSADGTTEELSKYTLERVSTPSGTEFYFKLLDRLPPKDVSDWIMSFPSGSSEDAITVCSLEQSGGVNWRSPSNAEVEQAMVNKDQNFILAMESTNTTMVDGYTSDGAFYFSNYSGTGEVLEHLGGKKYSTLCIQD